MSNLFGPNRQSIRLKDYDYATQGLYYITLCTHDRFMLFGDVQNDVMQLSPPGEMVHNAWLGITMYDPVISLDEFIVMPNHLHGIVGIGLNVDGGRGRCPAPTISLSDIVRRFKTWTTYQYQKGVRDKGWKPIGNRLWQRNYYENIVRDSDLDRIRQYIRDNPKNWPADLENQNK